TAARIASTSSCKDSDSRRKTKSVPNKHARPTTLMPKWVTDAGSCGFASDEAPFFDRRGRRAVVLPASVVALAGTCLLAGGQVGFGVLLAGRFVVGLGAGATFTAGTAWLQDLAGGEAAGTGPRRAAGALSSGFGGGPLLTGVLAQWLPWPMQLPYAVHAAVLVATIVAVVLAPRSEPAGDAPHRSPTAATNPSRAGREASQGRRRLPSGFATVAVVAPWVFVLPSVSSAVLPGLVRAKLGAFAVVFAGLVT